MERIKTAVLGATGLVGQAFVWILSSHGWFDLELLAASAKNTGLPYGEAVRWRLPFEPPSAAAGMRLSSAEPETLQKLGIQAVFSALPSSSAESIEPELSKAGFWIFSNASSMRYLEEVPILIPEINPESIRLISRQGFPEKGFVITNANCTTTGLALALSPLRRFGIKRLFLSTYQALSGAGHHGFENPHFSENAVPWIEGEEEKVTLELDKILGIKAEIFPFCVRIPVPCGHLETVWLELEEDPSLKAIEEAWREFGAKDQGLPSMPRNPVKYLGPDEYPHPKMSFEGNPAGMQVFTGRLKKRGGYSGFVLLSNNLIRGAAGGSVENAELFLRRYNFKP